MNRFEIIFERIGAITKEAPENVVLHRLAKQANKLRTVCNGGNPTEEELIKIVIDELFYDLIVIANKHDICGACACSNLEYMTRKREFEAGVRKNQATDGFVDAECETCGSFFVIPEEYYDPTKPIMCTRCKKGEKE